MQKLTSLILASISILWAHPALAQSSSLIAAAKKEGGKVIVYTSMETFTADALKRPLRRRPGCKWNIGAAAPPK
ncbi:MAG TPA: hypothetical protein VHM64_21825 [Candidatus Binatia bacterium]|nr:hypothetical protein [Candidatus Binatia bacterium]